MRQRTLLTLRATTVHPEVQSKILDLAFDGDSLFGNHIDEALTAIKKDTDTAKALGTLQYLKVPFRGARGRGFSEYRGNYQLAQTDQSYQPQYRQGHQQQSYRQPTTAGFSRHGSRRKPVSQALDSGRKQ